MKAIVFLLCVTFIFADVQNKSEEYVHDMFDHNVAQLANLLRTKSDDQLRSYCFKIDSWIAHEKVLEAKVNRQISKFSSEDCIKYIISLGYQNKQLLDMDFFNNNIVNSPEEEKENVYNKAENNVRMLTQMGGLHDYIFFQSRETLERWALTCEIHHRKVNKMQLIAGLQDYIETLTRQELVEYILKEAEEHFELNSGQKLDSFAKTYGIGR